jgi:hypothetical protein
MNWIIKESKKLQFHTNLEILLYPILNEIKDWKWIFSDIEFVGSSDRLPINFEDDYFILQYEDLKTIMDNQIQIFWGALIAVPNDYEFKFNNFNELPYVEGNDNIWNNDYFQINEALMEIDCFDGSYTIIKFKDLNLSIKFRDYFGEAIELEKFN